MVLVARRVAHMTEVVRADEIDEDIAAYVVVGELFSASSHDLVHQLDYDDDPSEVVIDLSRAHIWDASTVAALDAITAQHARRGKQVTIVDLDADSATRHGLLAGQLGAGH